MGGKIIVFGQMRGAIVCGGRGYGERRVRVDGKWEPNPFWQQERDHVWRVLDAAVERLGLEFIVQGAGTGADYAAWCWADARGFPCGSFAADWDLGRKAGPLRNETMLREAMPHCVIAFPGGSGTAHMMSIAREAGVPVHECRRGGAA